MLIRIFHLQTLCNDKIYKTWDLIEAFEVCHSKSFSWNWGGVVLSTGFLMPNDLVRLVLRLADKGFTPIFNTLIYLSLEFSFRI